MARSSNPLQAQQILVAAGLQAAWDIYNAGVSDKQEESIVFDIVSKLVRYGSISDKALSFVRSLVEKIAKRSEIEAERARAWEAAQPVPTIDGRILIEGEVLSVKGVDGRFGYQTKVLVQHADGWKVWGTQPIKCERGDVIRFYAKVEPSDKDAKFGFFSRPTKAEVVSSAPVEQLQAA